MPDQGDQRQLPASIGPLVALCLLCQKTTKLRELGCIRGEMHVLNLALEGDAHLHHHDCAEDRWPAAKPQFPRGHALSMPISELMSERHVWSYRSFARCHSFISACMRARAMRIVASPRWSLSSRAIPSEYACCSCRHLAQWVKSSFSIT